MSEANAYKHKKREREGNRERGGGKIMLGKLHVNSRSSN